ncbi:uncharacterized protein B0P05DRAFT_588297 [Gilbertella persicaria]|uniref:uncharacterized protein n=1 Tax=Gilbertella persicaria TaxID=101096 RepID=UPI00222027F2|nr:uncharacterized protein B0P05DRAFT_588297 [Gilbertella persicaria]KAI8075879.1 hypothetical protein B0P05DRAFT_588297 [Gilbertella persicaria]
MSVQNLITKETFPLIQDGTITMGRGSYGIESPYISRQQVEITYLSNHRCFVKKLSDKIMLLNEAALPLQQECEVKNQDIISFPIGRTSEKDTRIRFMLILPELPESLVRIIDRIKTEEGQLSDSDSLSTVDSEEEQEINLSDISSESDEITSRLFKQRQSH